MAAISGLSAGGDGVDVEQFEDAGLEPDGCGDDGRGVGGGGDEAELAQGVEEVAAGGAGIAVATEVGDLEFWGDGSSGFAFDEGEDQQGEADDRQERFDALVVLQEYGGDGEGAFEVAVAAFDDFLAFVAGEDLAGVSVGGVEVGEQAVPAVGSGFGVEGGLVEGPGQRRLFGRVEADGGAQVVTDAALRGRWS